MEICPVKEIYMGYIFSELRNKYKKLLPNFMSWYWAQFTINDTNYFPQIHKIEDHIKIFENEYSISKDEMFTLVMSLRKDLKAIHQNIASYEQNHSKRKLKYKIICDVKTWYVTISYVDERKTIYYDIPKVVYKQLSPLLLKL